MNKFRARKTRCAHGHTHDSGREARRCDELHLMLRGGEIEDLRIQPQFWFTIDGRQIKHPNGRRVGYKPDFQYVDRRTGRDVIEESKGVRTEAYVLRIAIFKALYPAFVVAEV